MDIQPCILIDTREPDFHPWEQYFSCQVIRGTLPTGDFSLPGCEEWIAIERKTIDDLIGCLLPRETDSPGNCSAAGE